MDFSTFAHGAGLILEAIGIGVILVGAAVSLMLFVIHLTHRAANAFERFRRHLGRAILLGLEFLVAADIIGTVAVEPTFENLGVLGLIVVIRTFLSFSLEVEVNGRWPWQGPAREGPSYRKKANSTGPD